MLSRKRVTSTPLRLGRRDGTEGSGDGLGVLRPPVPGASSDRLSEPQFPGVRTKRGSGSRGRAGVPVSTLPQRSLSRGDNYVQTFLSLSLWCCRHSSFRQLPKFVRFETTVKETRILKKYPECQDTIWYFVNVCVAEITVKILKKCQVYK